MTVLQELIKKWESEMGRFMPSTGIYKAFIDEAKEFLPKEKEQIIEVFETGKIHHEPSDLSGEEYYNSL